MNHEKIMRSIHDIFHPSLPRLAPGDEASTRRALEILFGPDLDGGGDDFQVLDMGCGNGVQTLRLATELGVQVKAVDNHQPYLDELNRRAADQGLSGHIQTHCADMTDLDLGEEKFNLVWAEGSAFVMGIPQALEVWRNYLKPGGALGFTELAWLKEDVPEECRNFFAREYPPMKKVASLQTTIQDGGYELVGQFTLPESSWKENFYGPLRKRMQEYKSPWDDEEAHAVLRMVHGEIEMYDRYSPWYGYVFFLLRSRSS